MRGDQTRLKIKIKHLKGEIGKSAMLSCLAVFCNCPSTPYTNFFIHIYIYEMSLRDMRLRQRETRKMCLLCVCGEGECGKREIREGLARIRARVKSRPPPKNLPPFSTLLSPLQLIIKH